MSELVLQVSRTAETVTPRVPSETRANKMMFGGGVSRNRLGLPETSPSEGTLCALRVTPGHERAMASRVRRVAAAGLNDCYVMLTEYERRRAGTWRRELVPTFPSYLFLDVRDSEALERGLRLVTEPAELPRVGGVASALPADDAALLRALAGRDHVIRVSRGSIEDGRLRVWEGPLAGRERLVRGIDRHRRAAYLDSRLGEGLLRVGLEVVSKS